MMHDSKYFNVLPTIILFALLALVLGNHYSFAQEGNPLVPAREIVSFLDNKTGMNSHWYWYYYVKSKYHDPYLMDQHPCIEENYIWYFGMGYNEQYNQFYALKKGCENSMINLDQLKPDLKKEFLAWRANPTVAELMSYILVELNGSQYSSTDDIITHDQLRDRYPHGTFFDHWDKYDTKSWILDNAKNDSSKKFYCNDENFLIFDLVSIMTRSGGHSTPQGGWVSDVRYQFSFEIFSYSIDRDDYFNFRPSGIEFYMFHRRDPM